MNTLAIDFDIRALRARDFEEALAMIASSSLKNHDRSPPGNSNGHFASFAGQRASSDGQSNLPEAGQSLDFFGFHVSGEQYQAATSKFESMQGQGLNALMPGDVFCDLANAWKWNHNRLAEREFRVYSGVLSRIDRRRGFASIRREEIKLAAAGFGSLQDYETEAAKTTLLTDMQIRSTLDELQSRGLFTSVVYGKRHRYFSNSLSQTELAEEVLKQHSERANRRTLNIRSVRFEESNRDGS